MFDIRRLAKSDATDYRSLRLPGLAKHSGGFGASFAEESVKDLTYFADRLERNVVFGGFGATRLLGVGGYYLLTGEKLRHKGVLFGMYVAEDAQGSGLAGLLVTAILDHARYEVEQLQLSVTSSNDRARKLYEKHEFRVYGTEPRAIKLDDDYLDEVLMYRILD